MNRKVKRELDQAFKYITIGALMGAAISAAIFGPIMLGIV